MAGTENREKQMKSCQWTRISPDSLPPITHLTNHEYVLATELPLLLRLDRVRP